MIGRTVTDCGRRRVRSIRTAGLAVMLAVCSAFPLTGCRKQEEAPPPPPPTPQRRETVPEWSDILITVPTIEKVSVEDAVRSDCTKSQMQETIRFLNAYASGNEKTLRPMLDPLSQKVLDDLVIQGLWQSETFSIRKLTLLNCTGTGRDFSMGFTIETDSGSSQTYTWTGQMRGNSAVFTPYVRMPEEPVEPVDTGTRTGESASGEESDRSGRDSQPSRDRPSRDPRRRVPEKGRDPGNPGGPG